MLDQHKMMKHSIYPAISHFGNVMVQLIEWFLWFILFIHMTILFPWQPCLINSGTKKSTFFDDLPWFIPEKPVVQIAMYI